MDDTVTLTGFCDFHSEASTEGGYWAFQDEHFIVKNIGRRYCRKCGLWLSSQDDLRDNARPQPMGEKLIEVKELFGNPLCPNHQHEEMIGDAWSYEGLHVLKDGDQLTIHAPDDPDEVIWSGTIKLIEHRTFTEKVFGMWIHADQEGIERQRWAQWFFTRQAASLIIV